MQEVDSALKYQHHPFLSFFYYLQLLECEIKILLM